MPNNAQLPPIEKDHEFRKLLLDVTRKYPLRGYILGVLTHTIALDRLWGGDETLNTHLSFAWREQSDLASGTLTM